VTREGQSLGPNEGGLLVMRQPWPSMLRTLYGDHDRFKQTYFHDIPGCYFAGDGARHDEDGYIWFVGRSDDIISSSSYRISPFEVESTLIEHPAVAEAAVVGKRDELRGEIVKAFIILAKGYVPSEALALELQNFVKEQTAPYKYPREIEFRDSLPKTISGKIRRVELRAQA
jgi:acetyl-CoA synthetase